MCNRSHFFQKTRLPFVPFSSTTPGEILLVLAPVRTRLGQEHPHPPPRDLLYFVLCVLKQDRGDFGDGHRWGVRVRGVDTNLYVLFDIFRVCEKNSVVTHAIHTLTP